MEEGTERSKVQKGHRMILLGAQRRISRRGMSKEVLLGFIMQQSC